MITTVTRDNSQQLVDDLNADFAAGRVIKVNGEMLKTRFGGDVARSWGNGTVSFTVTARTTRGTRDVFVKIGSQLVTQA